MAAFRTTSDISSLTEAAQKYPGDPQVAFEAAIRLDASPAERLPWLEALRQASPDNALPDYLAAVAHFQTGDQGAAVNDLIAASGKTGYQDFSRERTEAMKQLTWRRVPNRGCEIVLQLRPCRAAALADKGAGWGSV